MLLGGALSLAQPCHSLPFQNRGKRYVRLAFGHHVPIRGITHKQYGIISSGKVYPYWIIRLEKCIQCLLIRWEKCNFAVRQTLCTMLRRKFESVLVEWINSGSNKPLVIKGIRQCGKTYIVQKFAEGNYESVIYMNFILEPDKKSAFAGNIDVDTIILNLSALIPGSRFVKGRTCIILDEIQECREARTAL